MQFLWLFNSMLFFVIIFAIYYLLAADSGIAWEKISEITA